MCILALLTFGVVWAVNLTGSGDRNDQGGGSNGDRPASSITPGPTGSGPAISSRPGGRDETGGGGTGGGTGSGGQDGGGEDGAGTGDGSGSGSGSGGGRGAAAPGVRGLPDCSSDDVALTVRSTKNAYAPDEKPEFELVAENATGSDCKLDFTRGASLTITHAADDEQVWASGDCPRETGQLLLAVPAGEKATEKITWNRKPSEPRCATPRAGSTGAGTYLVEARADGLHTARVSFALKKD